ncbi:MAG: SIS domain-containing protein [Candidatus Limnocylindrales bacterium]
MTIDRVAAFEADIAASPAALGRLLDSWSPPDLGGRRRFTFAGLGSSRFAALVLASSLRASGTDASVEYASTSAPTRPDPTLVLVAISASGRTAEVVAAARRHRGTSVVVAVTNAADSPLADAADHVVTLDAGEESAGIACRSFRATLAALALLTGTATLQDLRPVIAELEARLATSAGWLPPLVTALDGAPSIDVLADASLLGFAEQAALMLREAPRLPARAWDTTDWLHTGVYLALPGHRVTLFPGSAADDDVIATVERRGGAVVSVVPAPGGPIARAIGDSIAAEVVAAALWAQAKASDKRP